MRGKIMFKILEAIGETGEGAADCIDAFLRAGYGASLRGMQYELSKIENARARRMAEEREEKLLRERLRVMLHRLRKSKLVIEDEQIPGRWKITPQGNAVLESLRKNEMKHGIMPEIFSYHSEPSVHLVIVVFDIPEKERSKRDWLRTALKHLGFKILQKSVFIGKRKIPKELLNDLKRCALIHAVDIFAISKTGSLRQVL